MSQARRLVCTLSSPPDTRSSTAKARHCFRCSPFGRTIAVMSRLPRAAALHVGEFAIGVLVAYAAVGGAFALTQSIWPVLAGGAAHLAAPLPGRLPWGPHTQRLCRRGGAAAGAARALHAGGVPLALPP